jgi:hypothetical protein
MGDMNKRVGRFVLPLLIAALLLQSPTAALGQRSKGVIGRHQVLIINNSGRPLDVEAQTPWGCRRFRLYAEGDVTLENVKLIRVSGTNYLLAFKNRYALHWDEQKGRAYVSRLVM